MNLIARDWRSLSVFYQKAFGCQPVPKARDLRGDWLDKLNGMKGACIEGEHFRLPGYGDGLPTPENFSYPHMQDSEPAVNRIGFARIAFEGDNIADTCGMFCAKAARRRAKWLARSISHGNGHLHVRQRH